MGRLLCSVKQLSFVYILYVVVCEYDAQGGQDMVSLGTGVRGSGELPERVLRTESAPL